MSTSPTPTPLLCDLAWILLNDCYHRVRGNALTVKSMFEFRGHNVQIIQASYLLAEAASAVRDQISQAILTPNLLASAFIQDAYEKQEAIIAQLLTVINPSSTLTPTQVLALLNAQLDVEYGLSKGVEDATQAYAAANHIAY